MGKSRHRDRWDDGEEDFDADRFKDRRDRKKVKKETHERFDEVEDPNYAKTFHKPETGFARVGLGNKY